MKMRKDEVFDFQKRWTALEKLSRDVDYQISVYALDLRNKFPKGDAGDEKFVDWCVAYLTGINEARAKGLLTRALTAAMCDENTYKRVGGAHKKVVQLAFLDKKEQIATIDAAKTQNKQIADVMRERAIAQGKMTPPPPRINYYEIAQAYTQFMERGCRCHKPKDIELYMKQCRRSVET